eukprot:SAG11_NODE_680_length_7781_cov_6.490497_6_plen_50_part_00
MLVEVARAGGSFTEDVGVDSLLYNAFGALILSPLSAHYIYTGFAFCRRV